MGWIICSSEQHDYISTNAFRLEGIKSINNKAANNRVQRTRHKVSGPLTRDVRDKR